MNDLQTSFVRYAEKHRLLPEGGRVLAAVSGGIDSMVMLRLLRDAGMDCAVAHCNFGLRGEESDGDEQFVKTEASTTGCPLHTVRFDTEAHAESKGISIQMAARELRYGWFEELACKHDYSAVAIAHHRDDRIETLFINLARGTGIRGLTGIKPASGLYVRPLLFASRNEITAYAESCGIAYREDSSNAGDKYARNFIRHHIIPGLERFFPGLQTSIERDIEHFSGAEAFYEEAIERFKQQVTFVKDGLTCIDLPALLDSPSPTTLLFEILNPFGFSRTVITDILDNAEHHSGRQFFSNTHRLITDRQSLTIQPIEKQTAARYEIEESASEIYTPVRWSIRQFDNYSGFVPDANPNVACLDRRQLHFPLLLRKWEHGDSFRPLGMKHSKKLSDFFINNKLSLIEKERLRVLVSGEQIVWVTGMRIDDRFKITDQTRRIVRIEQLPPSV